MWDSSDDFFLKQNWFFRVRGKQGSFALLEGVGGGVGMWIDPADPERQYGMQTRERQTQTWVQIPALTFSKGGAAGKSLTGSASLFPSVRWGRAIDGPGPL